MAGCPQKQRKNLYNYPEFLERLSWWCLQSMSGGRWSEKTATFISKLAPTRAREAPAIFQRSIAAALTACWCATLVCSRNLRRTHTEMRNSCPNIGNLQIALLYLMTIAG